jgi:hypothetical protein
MRYVFAQAAAVIDRRYRLNDLRVTGAEFSDSLA